MDSPHRPMAPAGHKPAPTSTTPIQCKIRTIRPETVLRNRLGCKGLWRPLRRPHLERGLSNPGRVNRQCPFGNLVTRERRGEVRGDRHPPHGVLGSGRRGPDLEFDAAGEGRLDRTGALLSRRAPKSPGARAGRSASAPKARAAPGPAEPSARARRPCGRDRSPRPPRGSGPLFPDGYDDSASSAGRPRIEAPRAFAAAGIFAAARVDSCPEGG
jgi:hypothetical protein